MKIKKHQEKLRSVLTLLRQAYSLMLHQAGDGRKCPKCGKVIYFCDVTHDDAVKGTSIIEQAAGIVLDILEK